MKGFKIYLTKKSTKELRKSFIKSFEKQVYTNG